jgi:hypothetical protein
VRVGIPVADLTAGLFCANGIMVALLAREETGEGQWVQTSLLQAQVAMLDFQATRWLMDGEVPKQAGNNHPTSIPTGVFQTADGHINLAVTGQVIWERFCRSIGREDLLQHPDYKSAALRSKNRDALGQAINEALRGATSAPGSTASTRPACPAARSIPSTRFLPTPRCSISASRSPSPRRRSARSGWCRSRDALGHAEQPAYAAARERRAHRGDPRRIRLQRGTDQAFRREGTV